MESDVVRRLRSFTLTEDEEEDILLEPEVHKRAMERCSYSLVGKVLTNKSINSVALKDTMKKLVVLRKWEPGMRADNVQFQYADFWVQLWGLPFEYISSEIATIVGKRVGEVLDVDEKSINEDRGKFMRVRVRIRIDKPLKRGGNLVDRNGNKVWITYKYERLPIFCFFCGILGHEERNCRSRWETGHGDAGEETYGPWMQVTLARGRRLGRKGDSSDDGAPSNGRFSDEGESALRLGMVAERDSMHCCKELVEGHSGCSGGLNFAPGGRLMERVDDVVVTSKEMTSKGRKLVQAPRKVFSKSNVVHEAGDQLVSNLNGEFVEGKGSAECGANFFELEGLRERAHIFKSEDSLDKLHSNIQAKIELGPKELFKAQGREDFDEAQLLEVSVHSLGLDELPFSGDGLGFKAQGILTPNSNKRCWGRGRGPAGLARDRKARARGGSSGGVLLGKRRSSSDGEFPGDTYNVGASKRFVFKSDDAVQRVEEASSEWPHQMP
ncbi:hypothetical protein Vadar_010394 [Vaccinium darrowii]|uniref:Uncharacterized protein n=1 Tax=Vaccinium darrowii TaxID=229202 RepID=A0ACB7XGM1_9ERIC|nr:hypothetical protein Vadar_010394 [Vaccinium darrowii]